jgi:hypothetical protein
MNVSVNFSAPINVRRFSNRKIEMGRTFLTFRIRLSSINNGLGSKVSITEFMLAEDTLATDGPRTTTVNRYFAMRER